MGDRFQETRNRCYTYFKDNEIDHRDEVFDILMSIDTRQALNCQWIFDQYKEGHFLLEDADEVKDVIQQFYRNRNKLPRDRRELSQYSYPEVLAIISSFPLPVDRRTASCRTFFDRLNIDDNIFSILMAADPEGGRNCQWLFHQYRDKEFLLEDIGEVKENLTVFFNNRVTLPVSERSLSRYTYSQLKQLITRWDLTDYDFTPVISDDPDILVLSHTGYGKLSTPVTEVASCILGSGTKWCTAASITGNVFDEYNVQGPLYIWDDYQRGKKFQFHFQTAQFKDNKDDSIDIALLRYYRYDHPIMSRFFGKFDTAVLAQSIIDQSGEMIESDDPSIYVEEVLDNNVTVTPDMLSDPSAAFVYAIKGDHPELEPVISTDPKYAYYYAKIVIKGRWPEAEPTIISNPRYAYEYANNIIKGRWYDAEPYIMTSPKYAYEYAKYVIQGRWYEAEPIIMRNSGTAYMYAKNVIKGRWPEAEPLIMKDPADAFYYANDVIKGRWPEAEPYIMTSPEYTLYYTESIMRGRWYEAEPYIMKNPYYWEQYKQLLM